MWDVVNSVGAVTVSMGLLKPSSEIFKHYVGCWNLCVDCHRVYAGFTRTMVEVTVYMGAIAAFILDTSASMWAAQELCRLPQPPCGIRQPLCWLHMLSVDCWSLHAGHWSLYRGVADSAWLFSLCGLHRRFMDCYSLCVFYSGAQCDVVDSAWYVAGKIWDVRSCA